MEFLLRRRRAKRPESIRLGRGMISIVVAVMVEVVARSSHDDCKLLESAEFQLDGHGIGSCLHQYESHLSNI